MRGWRFPRLTFSVVHLCTFLVKSARSTVARSTAAGTSSMVLRQPSRVSVTSEIDLVTRLSHIQSYLDFRIADPDCKRKVMSYYSHAYRQTGKLFDEALILSELPRPLRERRLQVIGRENLEKMPFMTGMADACVGELFIRFSHYTFDRGMLALLQHVCPRA